MPFQDFREFLGALRKHGELIDIDRPVALELEVAKAFGLPIKRAGEAATNVCGPALAEHGREYIEVADVPGWKNYDFPELRKRGA
jgi:hypothetical protein